MVNNHHEADELTQEVFVKVYNAIGGFKGESKFSTWLYTLASNACRSRLRRVRRISFFESTSIDAAQAPEEGRGGGVVPVDPADLPHRTLERNELQETIGRAVATLPEEFRMAVVMRDIQGLSYEEIATALKCSEGTVKSRIARGRARLKEKLKREGVLCSAKK